MHTYSIKDERYVLESCPKCGVSALYPKHMYDAAMVVKARRDGRANNFYCPNGHSWHYAQDDEPKEPKPLPPELPEKLDNPLGLDDANLREFATATAKASQR